MLADLVVSDIGIFEHAQISLDEGMIALTGETGAGKTLIVDALNLLLGARAEEGTIRSGAAAGRVEARLWEGGEVPRERVVVREISAKGRSRAWIDGHIASLGELAELVGSMVEVHAQHGHHLLLSERAQREALDVFGKVDSSSLIELRRRIRQLEGDLASPEGPLDSLGELQAALDELVQAGLGDPDEEDRLREERDLLAKATQLREVGIACLADLAGPEAAGALEEEGRLSGRRERLGVPNPDPALEVVKRLARRLGAEAAYAEVAGALAEAQDALEQAAMALRLRVAEMEDDPERLAGVQERLAFLGELRRKHRVADLRSLIELRERLEASVVEATAAAERRPKLAEELERLRLELELREAEVLQARRTAAERLEGAIAAEFARLGMPNARLKVRLVGRAGDESFFVWSANPGESELPLSKAASGGELARAMLALRLVLSAGPETVVFDEVDSGIGGQAALAVGSALWSLAQGRQVIVVTHLAQVAAFASSHLSVSKETRGGRTVAEVREVSGEEVGGYGRVFGGVGVGDPTWRLMTWVT